MVDALYNGIFMLKSENDAWQLFETLSKNSLHYMSRDSPMFRSKRCEIYEIENFIDIHSKMDELSQKINHLLKVGHTSALSSQLQDVCALYESHPYGEWMFYCIQIFWVWQE